MHTLLPSGKLSHNCSSYELHVSIHTLWCVCVCFTVFIILFTKDQDLKQRKIYLKSKTIGTIKKKKSLI